jgi:ribokinase
MLPVAGQTVTGGVFERHFGGKGANQAVAAARLGARVAMVGAVGDDESGRASLAELGNEGVDVSGVRLSAGSATGVALIVVDASGENQIAVASGANLEVSEELVEAALASWPPQPGAVMLVVFEVGDEAVNACARIAAERGMTLVVNPAPARPLGAKVVAAHAIVIANLGEAEALTGESRAEAAARTLAGQTGAPAILTLGANGALIADGDRVSTVPAPRVEAVDSTGAGDTFVGAFAAELARGGTVDQAVHLAVVAAAVSVTAAGARGGMPRRDQLP